MIETTNNPSWNFKIAMASHSFVYLIILVVIHIKNIYCDPNFPNFQNFFGGGIVEELYDCSVEGGSSKIEGVVFLCH